MGSGKNFKHAEFFLKMDFYKIWWKVTIMTSIFGIRALKPLILWGKASKKAIDFM